MKPDALSYAAAAGMVLTIALMVWMVPLTIFRIRSVAKNVILFGVGLGIGLAATIAALPWPALASRNSSGTFSLYTPGNPVTTGTPISSSWANNTLVDMGTEITNSLDRGGRGGMTAPLKLASGSASFPSASFSAEPNSGVYRNALNDIRMAVNGSDVTSWTTSGLAVTGTLSTSVDTSATGVVFGGSGIVVDNANANNGWNTGNISNALKFGGAGTGEGIMSKRTSGAGQSGLAFFTGGLNRLSINNSGGIQIPGEFASTPGGILTGSYAGSYTISFGSLTAGTPATSSQTLTGVSVGGVCEVSVDGNIGANALNCYVSASNTIIIKVVPVASNTLNSGSYRVRVFQP